jgi:5'-methylthioadenosine phosphorylase
MSVAEIGVIGGSGFYRLFSSGRELTVQTPYGPTSDVITIGELADRACAFLPRHGQRHYLPSHKIPYRANCYAFKELGVTQIIGCCAAGALTEQHAVGDFVFADQLVDFTHGQREDTFFEGPIATHIGFTEPYCPAMRSAAAAAADQLKLHYHGTATVVVTNGPRFSTRAESEFFAAQGWHLENMTQYPEAVLARELTLSYLNVSLVTNSHVLARESHEGEMASAPDVIEVLGQHVDKLRQLVTQIAGSLPPADQRPDFIRNALRTARWV